MLGYMTKEQKLDFIFENHDSERIINRFGWVDTALLSDIKTLVYGSKRVVDHLIDDTHGAGNVSIPILVCTGLELASRLYAGKEANATENVRDFIKKYFPNNSAAQRIPLILWDGIRNGTNHVFIPNIIKTSTNLIEFNFFVNHNSKHSYVTKSKDTLEVHVNSVEFYQILKQAIEKYKSDLKIDETLQCHFIDGWREIENPRDRSSDYNILNEVKYLVGKLEKTDRINLFSNSDYKYGEC